MKDIQLLFEKGFTNAEIQKELGLSSFKVSYWKKKLGYALTPQGKDINWTVVQEDIDNGMTERELCKKHSFSSRTLYLAKKRGDVVHKPRPKLTKEQRQARKNEANARYRARLKEQTPEYADIDAMKSFYENCPEGYEVDHIIPISKGGLHTMENLQYLTITENRRKGDRLSEGTEVGSSTGLENQSGQ